MADAYMEEGVRIRLLISGINELEEHGLSDFSLRRAAIGAQVSCAAPYRHFKSKEDYISEIIQYVNSNWELLAKEIEEMFGENPRRLVIEMCVANLRFWIANHNYRSIFTIALDSAKDSRWEDLLDRAVISAVRRYADYKGLSKEETAMKEYFTRVIIAGTVMLVGSGTTEDLLVFAKKKLEIEFA